MAIVKGILIQPPAVFTFRIDDKGEGAISKVMPARRTPSEDAGILSFHHASGILPLSGESMGIHQIETVFKAGATLITFVLL